ncbi:MAG: hypothetical protein A3G20_04420 [Acidobacteria bacterium RIFCSPLOWO2_12_FULL_59_11]|nr:MAG: hypothetical protein A3G20_04420 [Acidobacteria bacterium RIFCSPLOWO2_12_FULL_59_11]
MSTAPELSEREAAPQHKKIWVIILGALLLGSMALGLFFLFRPGRSAAALLRFLPPDADLYVVADLEALQYNLAVKKWLADPPAFARDEEYEQFVKGTGFRYQQDLKQLALAKVGPDWLGAALVKLDRAKVAQHLESQGGEKIQEEEGLTIYRFGQTRPFRLLLLSDDLAVFTVGSDADPIWQMVKRYKGQLTDSGTAEVEQANSLGHLPEEGELQILVRMDRWLNSFNADPRLRVLELAKGFLKGCQRLYGSVDSGLTSLDFRVEAECNSLADAERIAQTSQFFLKLLAAAPQSGSQAMDQKLPTLLAGVSVHQVQRSVLFEWRWDRETLRLLEQNSK